jgi:Tol biopolymer transport system component
MPVRRHVHDKLGSVYAFKSELDAWARSRHDEAEPAIAPTAPEASQQSTRGRLKAAPTYAIALTVIALALVAGIAWWVLERRGYFWSDPLAGARFQSVTDFGGAEQAAAISRDGRFVAFLSDRDGQADVWVTQIGAGQFYNLTRGRVSGLGNPAVRALGFSPDGALVTFWARSGETSNGGDIGVGAVPTLGGQPQPYLQGTAEYDWTSDGSRVVYHLPGPGDPTFVKETGQPGRGQRIFQAVAGRHAHFPIWSADGDFVYFVQGSPPDDMDIWRVRPSGGDAERVTQHNSRVSHPVFINRRTLMYLASDKDGSGPWLYSVDIDRGDSHRVSVGLDRYTSLAASADGTRLVATRANPNGSLWRVPLGESAVDASAAKPISLTTGRGFSPRLGPGYLLYVSSRGGGDGIWKLANGATTELWSEADARVIGGPEIARDGRQIVFSVEQRGATLLYAINADGTNARVVTASLGLRGAPAWAPDGQSITSAANVDGTPRLFRISLDGATTPLVADYGVDPAWFPSGDFLVYSGPDIGTTFAVKAATNDGKPYPVPNLTLTRGARRLRFLPGRRALVVMRGDIEHKNLWLVDLDTGAERQLTNLPADFNVRDFDVAPDGREIVLERVQDRSDVVLIELPTR